MNWVIFVQLFLQYGLPTAERIFQKWNSAAAITQADIDELKALAAHTPKSQMEAALTRAGIALDSPQAIALLALI